MFIRDLQKSDIPNAARILHQSWQRSFVNYVDPMIVGKFTYEACEDIWQKILGDKASNLRHLGAFCEESLLGTITVGPSRFTDKPRMEIWAMHVDHDKQRIGIGTGLLKEAFKLANDGQHSTLHLLCIKDNHQALDFYLKNGGTIGKEFAKRGFQEVEIYWDTKRIYS